MNRAVITFLLLGCSASSRSGEQPKPAPPFDAAPAPSFTYADLEATAVISGCSDVADCDAAPVGLNSCGNVNGYVIFCKTSTDTGKLEAIRDFLNQKAVESQPEGERPILSCYNPQRPTLELVDGSCREKELPEVDDDDIELVD